MTQWLKPILVWILGTGAFIGLQLSYQVNEFSAWVAANLLAVFSVLLGWSAHRLGVQTLAGVLKLVLVCLVAGLMLAQAMDIVYQASSLPAGGRLALGLEVGYFALQLLPVAYLAGRFWPRAKHKIKSDAGEGQNQPE